MIAEFDQFAVQGSSRVAVVAACPALNTNESPFMPIELDTSSLFLGQSLVGQIFTRLTVLKYVGKIKSTGGTRRYFWMCRCSCGNTTLAAASDLKGGKKMSCNCLRDEKAAALKLTHGCARVGRMHPIYQCWANMRLRCSNPKSLSYQWYGGKGIEVCERWLTFRNFLAHMGPKWRSGLEIDRISSSGHYEPGNCKWSTRKEQMRNVSGNVWYELDGVRKVSADWCNSIGGNHRVVSQRLKLGWSLREALTTPVRIQKNSHVLHSAQ